MGKKVNIRRIKHYESFVPYYQRLINKLDPMSGVLYYSPVPTHRSPVKAKLLTTFSMGIDHTIIRTASLLLPKLRDFMPIISDGSCGKEHDYIYWVVSSLRIEIPSREIWQN